MEKYTDKGLTGLGNLGNTCYLNSVTQIYSNIIELNEFLDNLTKLNKTIDSLLLLEYDEIRKIIWKKNVIVIPKKYVSTIFKVHKQKDYYDFSSFIQNDFMEFYGLLNDAFHNSLKNINEYNFNYTNDFILSETNIVNNHENKYKKFISSIFDNDYSIINDIFNGVFEINIINEKKDKILSTSYDIFNSISLGMNKDLKTINNLIDNYFSPEILDGENMWYNDKTKSKEVVFKSIKIKRLPKILCIHLKRFTNNLRKIRNIIDFDNILNINNYLIDNEKEIIYELFGLVMHSGTLEGGHYFVNIKNPNNNWYNYNDTNVTKINIDKINKSYIYCLFYKLK